MIKSTEKISRQKRMEKMNKDTIYRQAAIDAIRAFYDEFVVYDNGKSIEDLISELPSAQPLTEIDYTELRHRFGETIERVVRDMITGKGERWNE